MAKNEEVKITAEEAHERTSEWLEEAETSSNNNSKLKYTFTTCGDVKESIKQVLEDLAKTDPTFKQKFIPEKMDNCYEWLIDQIKDYYVSKFKATNGGIEISNEQCFMACRHYFLEELWKIQKPSKKAKTNSSGLTPEQVTANIVKKHEKERRKEAKAQEPKAEQYEQINIFDLLGE